MESAMRREKGQHIRCVSPLTPSDCQELAEVVEKSGAEKLRIYLDMNSLDTVKRLCELCPGVRVDVWLSEEVGGWCGGVTFSPHTDNINMSGVTLYPGEVTKLHQLVSLSQSWIVNWLQLHDLGPEDWTELSRSLDTLDSVRWVKITVIRFTGTEPSEYN